MDATRISTGEMVAMKRVSKSKHPYEKEIGEYFSTGPIAADPRNHCIPIYDVLEVPDRPNEDILVMPLLRRCNDPPFKTVGEVVDFVTQIFEVCPFSYNRSDVFLISLFQGLQFMHEHLVAHRYVL